MLCDKICYIASLSKYLHVQRRSIVGCLHLSPRRQKSYSLKCILWHPCLVRKESNQTFSSLPSDLWQLNGTECQGSAHRMMEHCKENLSNRTWHFQTSQNMVEGPSLCEEINELFEAKSCGCSLEPILPTSNRCWWERDNNKCLSPSRLQGSQIPYFAI